jgi:hypothetical protein|tara:strand:- start:2313 stop:2633 length:321 start_codon:yes stop_codon:yes gene_type:complete
MSDSILTLSLDNKSGETLELQRVASNPNLTWQQQPEKQLTEKATLSASLDLQGHANVRVELSYAASANWSLDLVIEDHKVVSHNANYITLSSGDSLKVTGSFDSRF